MEVLQLHGREFVKASKAARDLGYAPDYIGQLCRSGAIRAERVGRNWYVDAEEIKDHKQSKQRSVAAKSRASLVKRVSLVRHVGEAGVRTTRTIQPIEYTEDDAPLVPRLAKRAHVETSVERRDPVREHSVTLGEFPETAESIDTESEEMGVAAPEVETEHVRKVDEIRPLPPRISSTETESVPIKKIVVNAKVQPLPFPPETFSLHAVPLKKVSPSNAMWGVASFYVLATILVLSAVFVRFDAVVKRDGELNTYRFDPQVPNGVIEALKEEWR